MHGSRSASPAGDPRSKLMGTLLTHEVGVCPLKKRRFELALRTLRLTSSAPEQICRLDAQDVGQLGQDF